MGLCWGDLSLSLCVLAGPPPSGDLASQALGELQAVLALLGPVSCCAPVSSVLREITENSRDEEQGSTFGDELGR